jgi:tRNA nucleotidyltransferase (CCA-adding enzyme)
MAISGHALARLHLALVTYRLSGDALEQFIERFRLLKGDRDLLLEVARLRERLPRLTENSLPASGIVDLVNESSDEARLLLRVASDSWLVRQRLDQYQRRLRHVRSILQGDDLRRMGIQPGPIYGDILRRLRAGRLDGQISSRAEEEAIVKDMLVL